MADRYQPAYRYLLRAWTNRGDLTAASMSSLPFTSLESATRTYNTLLKRRRQDQTIQLVDQHTGTVLMQEPPKEESK